VWRKGAAAGGRSDDEKECPKKRKIKRDVVLKFWCPPGFPLLSEVGKVDL
jgi:hypothetical protein